MEQGHIHFWHLDQKILKTDAALSDDDDWMNDPYYQPTQA